MTDDEYEVIPESTASDALGLDTTPEGIRVGWANWDEYILAATSSPDAALQAAEWLCQRDKRMPLTHYWGGQPSVEQHQVVWERHVEDPRDIGARRAHGCEPYRTSICLVTTW